MILTDPLTTTDPPLTTTDFSMTNDQTTPQMSTDFTSPTGIPTSLLIIVLITITLAAVLFTSCVALMIFACVYVKMKRDKKKQTTPKNCDQMVTPVTLSESI